MFSDAQKKNLIVEQLMNCRTTRPIYNFWKEGFNLFLENL